MSPQNGDPERKTEQVDGCNRWVARATRHELRLPLRYRLEGEEDWRQGETINISSSGLLFYLNELLEVNTNVEIIFETSRIGLLHAIPQQARVVRRVLSNWPETRLILAAKFCIYPGPAHCSLAATPR